MNQRIISKALFRWLHWMKSHSRQRMQKEIVGLVKAQGQSNWL